MTRTLLFFALLAAACDCGSDHLVSRACDPAHPCPSQNECRAGVCVPVDVVPPRAVDSGTPPGPCPCARGETCRDGQCLTGCAALACDAGTTCSDDFVACLAPVRPASCEARPDGGAWDIYERWRSDSADPFRHVIGAPVVADVDGDGAADVIATYFPDFGYAAASKVRALSGRDGHLLWETDARYVAASGLALGVATIDAGSGLTVFASDGLQVVALDARSGAVLSAGLGAVPMWQSSLMGAAWVGLGLVDRGAPGGAQPYASGFTSSNLAVVPVAFENDGKVTIDTRFTNTEGFAAVADLFDAQRQPGRDHRPEAVVVETTFPFFTSLAVVDATTSQLVARSPLPVFSEDAGCQPGDGGLSDNGGAPAIADLDGDGEPEVALAGMHCLSAFDPGPDGTLTLKWTRPIHDYTSGQTALSAFDFDDDGRAELLQVDEQTFRIVDGATGAERYAQPHCSSTAYDLVVVADLDGDGHAEVILSANTSGATVVGCAAEVQPGLHVLSERGGRWAHARPIWNQMTYHLTNVCDGEDAVCGGPYEPANVLGAIPRHEPRSWDWYVRGTDASPYNGYRLAVGHGFQAPELALAGVVVDVRQCPGTATLRARVENRGLVSVPPGVGVHFSAGSTEVGTASTTTRLKPGAFEVVRLDWQPATGTAWPVDVTARIDAAARQCSGAGDLAGPVKLDCE
ncbi:MAG: VCBS repeat-containing protein [Archangiaceae bacterium]|nr:VCBS repeat-containing protein [Archangiaceae bacterium]